MLHRLRLGELAGVLQEDADRHDVGVDGSERLHVHHYGLTVEVGEILRDLDSHGVVNVLEVVGEHGLASVSCPAVDGPVGDELAAYETRR